MELGTFKFPEPLFESNCLNGVRACLACGKKKAKTVLRNTTRDVCPLCADCSSDWNLYGYNILRRIKPMKLLWNLYWFKAKHWFRPSFLTIWKDIQSFKKWGNHMKKFRNLM